MSDSLRVEDGGEWWINTQSGSAYVINLDDMTHKRVWHEHDLRRDGEVLPLISLEPVIIGQPMNMIIDILDDGETLTHRLTSAVISIWRIVDDPPPEEMESILQALWEDD